jgi:hypothetical protein
VTLRAGSISWSWVGAGQAADRSYSFREIVEGRFGAGRPLASGKVWSRCNPVGAASAQTSASEICWIAEQRPTWVGSSCSRCAHPTAVQAGNRTQQQPFRGAPAELATLGEPINRVPEVDIYGDALTVSLHDLRQVHYDPSQVRQEDASTTRPTQRTLTLFLL